MVQLRHLEKALEAGVAEGSLKDHEAVIDEYLNENENISSSASTRLHETLYKLWTSDTLSAKDEGSGTLTPVSTKSVDSITSVVSEPVSASTARIAFLEVLVRLAPCIIDTDKLLVWWDELSVYAIDSTGHQLRVVSLSQEFIMGVITGSFYGHGDHRIAELALSSARAYAQRLIELYVSQGLPKKSLGHPNAERVRYVRQNCRIYFGHYGRKETKGSFTILNDFFVQPPFRLDMLNLVVEYLSQSQNSKLFKVYDTPFLESLLKCLEHDRTAAVLQLALTALSMLIVHFCDKLVPTRLLFRIYACFGRACSWQPAVSNSSAADVFADEEPLEDEEETTESSGPHSKETAENTSSPQSSKDEDATSGTTMAPIASQSASDSALNGASHSTSQSASQSASQSNSEITSESISQSTSQSASHNPSQSVVQGGDRGAWESLQQEPVQDLEVAEQSIDVLPLFTFLYGLFPQNTLLFCRQCDEYLAKQAYQRTFSDFWSRFMVARRVETIVREFRVDPLILMSTPETELSTSVQRFQSIGGALGVTSVITSRLVSYGSDTNVDEAVEEHQRYFQALTQPDFVESAKDQNSSEATVSLSSMAPGNTAEDKAPAGSPSDSNTLRGKALTDESQRSAAYWRRELLLLRNELAFTDFRRHMSEQRSLRWQKRASRWAIAELKNEELTRQNQLLQTKVGVLSDESQRAQRSARTIMRERSAYETKILDRNREFREQIATLEKKVLELQLDAEAARRAEAALSQLAQENEEKAGSAEMQLRALRNEVESARRVSADAGLEKSATKQTDAAHTEAEAADNNGHTSVKDEKLAELKFKIDSLQNERDAAVELMEREVNAAHAELARARAAQERQAAGMPSVEASADAVTRENLAIVARLKSANEELLHRCISVEHELRARKIHEEERMNELQAALLSARSFGPLEGARENRFRGRGGAQGIPRRA